MIRRLGTLLLASAVLSGCVQFRWVRKRQDDKTPLKRAGEIEVGKDCLAVCLDKLGAPHTVANGPNGAIDMIYSWVDNVSWGLSISYEVISWWTASVSYDAHRNDLQGLLLRFDDDLVLREMRVGKLDRIVTGGRDPSRYRHTQAISENQQRPSLPQRVRK